MKACKCGHIPKSYGNGTVHHMFTGKCENDGKNFKLSSWDAAKTKTPVTASQEDWIKRFQGLFGDPPRLREFKDGDCSFDDLRDNGLKFVETLLAEIQTYPS